MTTPIECEFLRESKGDFWIFECEIWLKNQRGVKSTTRVATVFYPFRSNNLSITDSDFQPKYFEVLPPEGHGLSNRRFTPYVDFTKINKLG
jgi:hypothetical protein